METTKQKKTKGELEIIKCYELLQKLVYKYFQEAGELVDEDTLHAAEMLPKEFKRLFNPQV
jgi:hypothetical protein